MKNEKLSSAYHRLTVLHQTVPGTGDVQLAGDELKRMLVRCERAAFLRGVTATLEELTPHLKTSDGISAANLLLAKIREKVGEIGAVKK